MPNAGWTRRTLGRALTISGHNDTGQRSRVGRSRSLAGRADCLLYVDKQVVGVIDKMNLDLIWLREDTPEDIDNQPAPEVIAREIVEDLQAALVEFGVVAAALEQKTGEL